jgi:hypothetical protein
LALPSRAYQFKLEEVEGFRYRSRDAWRAVTRIAVREARLKEIKQEVLNCEKLKVCFLVNDWMNMLYAAEYDLNVSVYSLEFVHIFVSPNPALGLTQPPIQGY